MRKLLLIICSIFFLGYHSFGQNQVSKPLTHEIMTKLKKVGIPAISPDGKWVVYSQVETSYNLDEQTSDLWLAHTDGKTSPRRITSSKSGEDNYFWSPSGDKIYFTAKRDGDEVPQLYSLPLNFYRCFCCKIILGWSLVSLHISRVSFRVYGFFE